MHFYTSNYCYKMGKIKYIDVNVFQLLFKYVFSLFFLSLG